MSAGVLSPVSGAVFTTLNVAALTPKPPGLVTGVFAHVPEGTLFPYIWFTVSEENVRGMGRGGLRQVNLRVYAASTYAGAKELQQIFSKVIELLEDKKLTITGHAHGGEVVYHDTTEAFDSVIGGVKCREAAANFTIWAEPV